MALFGKKDCCPVCGGAVKGMMNAKIKDKVTLCAECSKKIRMEPTMLPFQTTNDIKEHISYREHNQQVFDTFVVSREQKAGTMYIRVDDSKKLWYCDVKKPTNPPLLSFDEIVDYELSEDGNTVTKGGLGRVAAGGLLFGGVGAIVGGATGRKKSKTIIKSMKLRISLNNKYTNQIVLEFVPFGTDCKSGSMSYNMYKQEANSVISILDSMCSQAEREMGAQAIATPAASGADEILKFKQLLDAGVITEEEFNAKKMQLLGL